jgi:hypothetical protein
VQRSLRAQRGRRAAEPQRSCRQQSRSARAPAIATGTGAAADTASNPSRGAGARRDGRFVGQLWEPGRPAATAHHALTEM